MTTTALDTLAATLGDVLVTAAAELAEYAFAPTAAPLAVVRPESTVQVQQAMRWAHEHRVPVVIRGAGTRSASAGPETGGALVVCTDAMNTLRIDPAAGTATVLAGTPTADLHHAAAGHGLTIPIEPFSTTSTVGGDVATAARGAFALRFGTIAEYIESMRVVLADGTLVAVGPSRAHDASDHGLARLFTGSHGLLGVITEITLRLVDKPVLTGAVVATFGSAEDAAAAAFDIAMTCRPAALDLCDAATATLIGNVLDLQLDGTTLAVFSVDAPTVELREICLDSGADLVRTVEAGELLDALTLAHRRVLPVLRRAGAGLPRPVSVPETQLGAFLDCVGAITAVYAVPLLTLAHAGEGLCQVVAIDGAAPESEPSVAAVQALADVQALAAALSGNAAREAARPWMGRVLGAAGSLTDRRMKIALDPRGILNPGLLY